MAFGLKRNELKQWKQNVRDGKIDFITHYWLDDRFPGCKTVTKVGCSDLEKLKQWGRKYHLKAEWIDLKPDYPHFDLFGEHQKRILKAENRLDQLDRFQ